MKKTILLLFLFVLQFNITKAQDKENISLDGLWKLSYGLYNREGPSCPRVLKKLNWPEIKATVPGNVELDLEAAGIIENPETGNNIYDLRKYEGYQWWYSREFDTPKTKSGEQVEIVFEGLDCFGKIWVNNHFVGETDNMLIEHRFDVTKFLKSDGKNKIYIRINPAVREAQKYINDVTGARGWGFQPEGVHVRKAPHMYGWDIMPRLISAGLWRGVSLDIKKTTEFTQIYWRTKNINVANKKAEILLDWQIRSDYPTIDGLTMDIILKKGGNKVYEKNITVFTFCSRESIGFDNVDFWWPKGYGEPSLYEAIIRIKDKQGNILDENSQKIGIRTADLIHTDIGTSEDPGEFVFKINGEKIFIRGTNWVPLDALHSRDKTHLNEAINMAADLNCNMIRCWGGNVYEDNDFYDLCDKNGIMVWQDFAMACTPYPQDDDFAAAIRKEAISVVLKLRHHPSLVLWSGNNENDASYLWGAINPVNPSKDRISRKVLPEVIMEYDPDRSYLPSSPYYSESYFKNRGDKNVFLPEEHLWGPRGYYKAPFYTETKAHFVSEIGYHGCPNRSSLEKMFYKKYVYPWTKEGKWNDEWQTKAVRSLPESKTQDHRNDLMVKQVKSLFGECPENLDKFIFASQATQAEAMKYFIELWRMDKFRKTGIIWWNLRDGWPIISDAIVDYYNSKKLAYYYIRRVQTNSCVMIGDDNKKKGHPVVAVNDTRVEKKGSVIVRDGDSGDTVFSSLFKIPKNGKTVVGYIPENGKQRMLLIEYRIENKEYKNHYLLGKAPFKFEDYERWYKKLGIKRDFTKGNACQWTISM